MDSKGNRKTSVKSGKNKKKEDPKSPDYLNNYTKLEKNQNLDRFVPDSSDGQRECKYTYSL